MSVGVVFFVGVQAPSPPRLGPSAGSPPGLVMAWKDFHVSTPYLWSLSRGAGWRRGGPCVSAQWPATASPKIPTMKQATGLGYTTCIGWTIGDSLGTGVGFSSAD